MAPWSYNLTAPPMDPQPAPAMSTLTLTPEDLSLRQRKLDDRDTRLLTAITILTAVICAFCFVLAFQVSQYNSHHVATTAEVDECNEGAVPSGCSDGQICQGGHCTQPDRAFRCERGALCDDTCSCEAPLACNGRNVCTLTQDPGVCTDVSVLEFLALLNAKCGDPKKCETKDLERYAINYGDFLTLMMQFPSTLAVHFPAGQPSPTAARRWPNNEESAHYINRIRESIDELKAADRIIMVGLASQDRRQKDPEANRAITLQRLLTTQSLRYRAASSVLTAEEASAIEDKAVFIQLGDQRAIDARFYGSQAGNRPIAWDSGTENQLRNLVENGDRTADSTELRWRDRTLNQVVFVIPIPCKPPGGMP